jgi:hypothetical protein
MCGPNHYRSIMMPTCVGMDITSLPLLSHDHRAAGPVSNRSRRRVSVVCGFRFLGGQSGLRT